MFEPSRVKKTLVFVVIGLFIGAGIVPTIIGNEIRIIANDNDTIGIDVATRVASAKLHDLDKIDFWWFQHPMIFLQLLHIPLLVISKMELMQILSMTCCMLI